MSNEDGLLELLSPHYAYLTLETNLSELNETLNIHGRQGWHVIHTERLSHGTWVVLLERLSYDD